MSPKPITENTLFYGDNLPILRDYIVDESIDLIYLDPPFNSRRTYNVLFKDESWEESEAQMEAFEDTWHWDMSTAALYEELVTEGPDEVSKMMGSMRGFIGTNQMMAYLVMMAARLVELHSVLKSSGSMYLHCDPTASHYLMVVLDTIFGFDNYLNHIRWKRSDSHNDAKRQFPAISDHTLMYSKRRAKRRFNAQYGGHAEKGSKLTLSLSKGGIPIDLNYHGDFSLRSR